MSTISIKDHEKDEQSPRRLIGKSIDRVDGPLKVMGAARYAAEFDIENLAFGVIIHSSIANGTIRDIDTTEAEKAPGVLGVITHQNAPRLNKPKLDLMVGSWMLEDFIPVQDARIYYGGQGIGIIVADTFENAMHGAQLVKVSYAEEKPIIRTIDGMSGAHLGEKLYGFPGGLQVSRGDVKWAFELASQKREKRVDLTYTIPVEHHNPMELNASIAVWDGDHLTIYVGSQWIQGLQTTLSQLFSIPSGNVRVISYFTGGGFGSKNFLGTHEILCALAARKLSRPVKLVLSRQQLFSLTGHRPETVQNISISASKDGKLSALRHETISQISPVSNFFEGAGHGTSLILYSVPNLEISHIVVPLNIASPQNMRAPGEASGMFALECAMDELSYKLDIDPIKLRLINHADVNPDNGLPWSSKFLKECYELGAEHFGWADRNPHPRSMTDGEDLVGYGMATAIYPGSRILAAANVKILADGSAIVRSATHEIGTGTSTLLTQIAAETLGLPIGKIKVEIGDSSMPFAPVSGGSWTATSVGTAVQVNAEAALKKIMILATNDARSPLHGRHSEEIFARDGKLIFRDDPSRSDSFAEIIQRNNLDFVEEEKMIFPGDEQKKFSFHAFGAVFAEVKVDADLGIVRVNRVHGVYDIGRVLNPKNAHSQIVGGIIWGIGMALMEHTEYDTMHGRVITNNLADYVVPVNADVKKIEVEFIGKPDPFNGPLGAKGAGEIGITGVAAAISNAVYHATEKRIRSLPITPDKFLA